VQHGAPGAQQLLLSVLLFAEFGFFWFCALSSQQLLAGAQQAAWASQQPAALALSAALTLTVLSAIPNPIATNATARLDIFFMMKLLNLSCVEQFVIERATRL
jgi:hypothetical protein